MRKDIIYAHRADTMYVVSQLILSARVDLFLSIYQATARLGDCDPGDWLIRADHYVAVFLSICAQTRFDPGEDH